MVGSGPKDGLFSGGLERVHAPDHDAPYTAPWRLWRAS